MMNLARWCRDHHFAVGALVYAVLVIGGFAWCAANAVPGPGEP